MDSHNNTQDRIFDALRKFQCIRNPVLRWLVDVLPLLIIGFILFDLLVIHTYVSDNPMFLTGLFTAAAAAFCFDILLDQTPETLYILWTRNAVMPITPAVLPPQEANFRTLWLARIWSIVTNKPELEAKFNGDIHKQFYHFVVAFEARLNNWGGLIIGLCLALIMYGSFPYRLNARGYGGDWRFWVFAWLEFVARSNGWLDAMACLMQVAIAFVLGLLLWRMLIVANMVTRLAHEFDFDIQINHPDRCGGLRPLGDLCFVNALIISLPGIFLAGWILAIPYVLEAYPQFQRYASWKPFYEWLLLVLAILSFLTFFHPLNAVHHAMVRVRVHLRRQADEISLRIDELTRKLLQKATSPQIAETQDEDTINRQLDQLRTTYANVGNIPSWPFDRRVVLKFVSAQAIPWLTLTGIAPAALDIVRGLLSLIPSS